MTAIQLAVFNPLGLKNTANWRTGQLAKLVKTLSANWHADYYQPLRDRAVSQFADESANSKPAASWVSSPNELANWIGRNVYGSFRQPPRLAVNPCHQARRYQHLKFY